MNVSIITTVNHNVGDDFVREGILHLLEKKLGSFNTQLIHKHIPLTVRPEWEWFYTSGLSKILDHLPRGRGLFWSKIIDHLPIIQQTDKILNCDLLVQSGAPVYWSDAHINEWFTFLIRKRFLPIADRTPFINIGAGTCQHFDSDGSELINNLPLAAFIREFYQLCRVTTLRDRLSKKVLNGLGLNAPVIPCPSIFGRNHLGIDPKPPEYIALNFMKLGGHYEFEQHINTSKWEKTFKTFVMDLISQKIPVLLVCHNQKELSEAHQLIPDAPKFIASTAREYLECYSRARYFIGCRVHGAFATASFGKPAYVIGSDSRARMLEQINLSSVFVNNTSIEDLNNVKVELDLRAKTYPEEMLAIKQHAFTAYQEAFSPLEDLLHK